MYKFTSLGQIKKKKIYNTSSTMETSIQYKYTAPTVTHIHICISIGVAARVSLLS